MSYVLRRPEYRNKVINISISYRCVHFKLWYRYSYTVGEDTNLGNKTWKTEYFLDFIGRTVEFS